MGPCNFPPMLGKHHMPSELDSLCFQPFAARLRLALNFNSQVHVLLNNWDILNPLARSAQSWSLPLTTMALHLATLRTPSCYARPSPAPLLELVQSGQVICKQVNPLVSLLFQLATLGPWSNLAVLCSSGYCWWTDWTVLGTLNNFWHTFSLTYFGQLDLTNLFTLSLPV